MLHRLFSSSVMSQYHLTQWPSSSMKQLLPVASVASHCPDYSPGFLTSPVTSPCPEPWLTPLQTVSVVQGPNHGLLCSSCPRSQALGFCCPYAEGFHISFSCPDFLSDFHFQLPTQHLNLFIQLACLTLHGWNRIPATFSLPSLSCLTPFLWTSHCSQNDPRFLLRITKPCLVFSLHSYSSSFLPLFPVTSVCRPVHHPFLSASVLVSSLALTWKGPSLSLVGSFFPTSRAPPDLPIHTSL